MTRPGELLALRDACRKRVWPNRLLWRHICQVWSKTASATQTHARYSRGNPRAGAMVALRDAPKRDDAGGRSWTWLFLVKIIRLARRKATRRRYGR